MESIIEQYIDSTFHPELGGEIARSFELMVNFNVTDIESKFIDILMDQYNEDSSQTQERFLLAVHEKLDYLLLAHTLLLNPEATIREKNEFLDTLWQVQFLLDYNDVICVLESELDPEEQLAQIVGQLSAITATTAETLIESFEKSTLDTMKVYAYKEHERIQLLKEPKASRAKEILDKMRLFSKFIQRNDTLGYKLLESNVLLDRPLRNYLPYISDCFKNPDLDALAVDILTFIFLTTEGADNALDAYHKQSHYMLEDLNIISAVDVRITNLLNGFDRYIAEQGDQHATS